MSALLRNFLLYDLRVYALRRVHNPQEMPVRIVVGYLKSDVWKVHDALESSESYENCVDELHRRKGSELHKAFASIIGSREMIEEKTQLPRLRIPSEWIEPDLVTASEICIWQEHEAFELPPKYLP